MKFLTLSKIREALAKANTTDALRLVESEFSHEETFRALLVAVRASIPAGAYLYRYIADVYDTYVVYEEWSDGTDKLYKADYTQASDGTVTLGEAVPVRIEYVPVSRETDATESIKRVQESGSRHAIKETQIGTVRESAIRDDGTMQICIIKPGQGSSGLYSEAMLKRDIPKVFPAGTHMYADHPTATEESERPERSIKDLAAVFVSTPVWLDNGPDGAGMYTDVKAFGDYAPMLQEKARAIGVSINGGGWGEVNADGVFEIIALTEGHSVDFVTKAGAGGAIVSLKEAARAAQFPDQQPTHVEETTLTEQEAQALRESAAAKDKEIAQLKAQPAARDAASKALESLNLPAAARNRIVEAHVTNPPLKEDGSLDTEALTTSITKAAEAEAAYAKEAYGWGGGDVEGMGEGSATGAETTPVIESVANVRATLGL